MHPKDVIPFSVIVQNIRCDVLEFLKEDKYNKAFSIGGTVAAHVVNGVKSEDGLNATIPIATSLSVGLGSKRSAAQTYGMLQKQAVVIFKDDTPTEIDCSNNRQRTFKSRYGDLRLNGPLLNLKGIAEQYQAIRPADGKPRSPRMYIPGFRLTGSIVLVKQSSSSAEITVYVLGAKASNELSSTYQIDFDFATNYGPLVAEYEPPTPKAPSPNVVYVIQATEPPAARRTAGAPNPDPTPPIYDPGPYYRKVLGSFTDTEVERAAEQKRLQAILDAAMNPDKPKEPVAPFPNPQARK
ncbi:hypothetical protein [Sphingomonas sp. 4RDLI-65]|uniref:hypothetical protein n=1 Tax=Sphingomonas sp. 4RDLI-65 TaxID=3111641 RepID=UPI003C2B5BB6